MRIGVLTDGTTDWLIADWEEVVVYGTTEKQSFQVWIQLGDAEGIWMTYGSLTSPSAPTASTPAQRTATARAAGTSPQLRTATGQ